MKSRILFVLTLAAFFNPISVFAGELGEQAKPTSMPSVSCGDWANQMKNVDPAQTASRSKAASRTTDQSGNPI